MILGVTQHLGVRLPLGAVRVDAEPVPQVCSRCRFRSEGTHVTGWAGVPMYLDPRDPVTLGAGEAVASYL